MTSSFSSPLFFLLCCCLFLLAYSQEKFSKSFIRTMQELQMKSHFLQNISSVLDVGANNGDWSHIMRKELFPAANYFLIEGNTFYKKSFENQGFSYEIALVGDQDNQKKSFMYHRLYRTGGSIMDSSSSPGMVKEERVLTTIDAILERRNVPPPQLMKMDIQGAEFLALRGAEKALKSIEIVVVEVSLHIMYGGTASFTDVNLYLESQGFRIYDIADTRRAKWVYGEVKGFKELNVGTTIQADIVWIKDTSPFFKSAGFADPPPTKYKCDYIG